jgi:S-adenosylmethionine:tRNA ribosyltransferase-isomerase
MKLSDFDYTLPKELIAQYPLKERDSARMLVVERDKGLITHVIFKDILSYLQPKDLLVLNNTKVLACRLNGRKVTGGKVEVFLLNRKDNSTFNALIRPARLKCGEKILFNGGSISGQRTGKNDFTFNVKDISALYDIGAIPLPPYIKREAEELDKIYYQTVYASEDGAVASPTAGLHFTKELLEKIKSQGVHSAYITLHVGPGTFRPVHNDDITRHKMDEECFGVPDKTVQEIKRAQQENSRIIAVGTTSLRALETFGQGKSNGLTDIFIYPGFKFKIANCLLTNFHLPKTTLYMLVCAFAGEKLAKKAYQEAIDRRYRFYSYGDAMLIL